MPIETLINAVKRWALDTFPTAGGTWHTATVSLSDGGMSFVSRVPSPHNDGGDALTLTVDMSGAWAEAAEGGKLSMRFGDGSETPVFDGKCYVPRDSMVLGGDKLTVRAVVNSGAEEVVYTEGIVGYWVAKPHASGVQVGMWSANTDTKSAFLSAVEGMKVGQEYEIGFCGLTFTDVLMQKDAKYRVLGNQNCTANGTPTEGTPYHFTITLDGNGSVTQAALFTGTAIQLQGSLPVTIRKVGETVSNILTVPLQQGEAGMFTVVEGGKVKRLADAISVGADWDAEDGKPGHIANKPFGVELAPYTVFDGIYTSTTSQWGPHVAGPIQIDYEGMVEQFGSGDVPVVFEFDGVEYKAPANTLNLAYYSAEFGNKSLSSDSYADTGEPFLLSWYHTANIGQFTIYTREPMTFTAKMLTVEQVEVVQTLDEKFLPPLVGHHGEAEGAEVFNGLDASRASGEYSHAEGYDTEASGWASHVEGRKGVASGQYSHAEGNDTEASGDNAHAEGQLTHATKACAHAEGWQSVADGYYAHAEGMYTKAVSDAQHVQGKYNIEDTEGKYAHIVGNGTNGGSSRSNAHTIDWDGNAWFAGTVEGTALILKSPDGSRYQVTVGNDGTISAAKL